MNALMQPRRILQAAQRAAAALQSLSTPDYVAANIQQPATWMYDFDPATGVSRATYIGEIAGTSAFLTDAPNNNNTYGRLNAAWSYAVGITYQTGGTLDLNQIAAGKAIPIMQQFGGPITTSNGPSNQGTAAKATILSANGANPSWAAQLFLGDSEGLSSTPTQPEIYYRVTNGAGPTTFNPWRYIITDGGGTMTAPLNLVGVVNASNAAAGIIGEFLTAQQTTAVGLTTSTAANVVTLALTAGDWDVWGNVYFGGTATSFTAAQGWVNTASAASPASPALGNAMVTMGGASIMNPAGTILSVNPMRVNVAATTNVYLGAQAIFSGGTATATGIIAARRRR